MIFSYLILYFIATNVFNGYLNESQANLSLHVLYNITIAWNIL